MPVSKSRSTPKRAATSDSDAVLPDLLVEQLLAASPPATGSDARAAQRRARQVLMRRVAADSAAATRTVRTANGAWRTCLQGVDRMVVDEAGPVHTWLLRLAPGASLPAHTHHHGDEESLVLSGSCLINGELLMAGDYHHAAAGSRHGRLVSEAGCVLWLRLPAAQARAMLTRAGQ